MRQVLSSFASLLLFALVTIPSIANAESYFVRPTTGGSLPADQLVAIDELVRMGISQSEGATTVSEEKSADFVLEPKVVRLGQAYVLSISKIKSGKVVHQQQARATTIEDMDTVAVRVARATIAGAQFKKDTRVDDVTEDQVTRGKRRIKSIHHRYVALGPAATWNFNVGRGAVNVEIGRNWVIDERFALNLGLQALFFTEGEAGLFGVQMGLDFNFNENNHSPYITVGGGYAGAVAHSKAPNTLADKNANGFTASAGAGVKMFRTSDVNIGLSGRYMYVFDTNTLGNPSAFLFAVHFYF